MQLHKYLLTLLLFLFIVPSTIRAANYVFESGGNNFYSDAQVITQPQYAKYVFGVIGKGQETVDYYLLNFTDFASQVKIELLIDESQKNKGFSPSLIITEPGTRRMIGEVPFGFPLDVGGRVYNWKASQVEKVYHEEAFGYYWVGQQIIKNVAPRAYLMAIYDPLAQGGRYVLKIGSQDPPSSWRETLRKIIAFIRIKLLLY